MLFPAHFLIFSDTGKSYVGMVDLCTMVVTQREHNRIYDSARREQLEQDIAMIRDIVDRSEDYADFQYKLATELRKLDHSITGE